jgi:hypothetical protein
MFSAHGFNVVAGVAQPKAIVEVIDFNGDGMPVCSCRDAQRKWCDCASLPGGVGTYTVEDNCTGTIVFDGPTFDIFISFNREAIWMIQTNPNTVFQGTATRSSRARSTVTAEYLPALRLWNNRRFLMLRSSAMTCMWTPDSGPRPGKHVYPYYMRCQAALVPSLLATSLPGAATAAA